MFTWKTRTYQNQIKGKGSKQRFISDSLVALNQSRHMKWKKKNIIPPKKEKEKRKRHSFFKSSTSLSGCHSPCLTLSITMSQSSQVSLSSASWCWMDICQLYSSEYFDVARCDLAHYHTRHESILCIKILIIRCILITCTLAFAGLLHAPCLI